MKHKLMRAGRDIIPLLVNITMIVVAIVMYHRISLSVPRMTGIAHHHAAAIIDLERRLGILIEPRLQHLALSHGNPPILQSWLDNAAIRNAAKQIYTGGQIPWLASAMLWVLLFRPRYFRGISLLAIFGSLLGILIAAIYPVAPPRFAMAASPYHMQDVSMLISSEQELVRYGGFDPYAAMPSLHVFWAMTTALCLFASTERRVLRLAACLFPLLTIAAVIITGNHYVLDCVAAMGLFLGCLGGWWLLRLVARTGRSMVTAPETSLPIYKDRRITPDLRALDVPVVLCAFTGMILLPSAGMLPRLLAILMLAGGAVAAPVARKRIAVRAALRREAPCAEWCSGFLLVMGATGLGASDPLWQAAGGVVWTCGGLLPLIARYGPLSRSRGTSLGDGARTLLAEGA